jgi:hypothetical protein
MAYVIGVDCATIPQKVGLATGAVQGNQISIQEVALASRGRRPASIICEWIEKLNPSLIALDAPLGWPVELAEQLAKHSAGQRLSGSPDQLFHRFTDDDVFNRHKKRPLEVGANFLARTAHAALALIEEIRRHAGKELPLAWDLGVPAELAVIEVYPAATLRAHSLPLVDYKKPKKPIDVQGRQRMIAALRNLIAFPPDVSLIEKSADALDAVLCVLAAADFIQARAKPPADGVRALREGWIWVP